MDALVWRPPGGNRGVTKVASAHERSDRHLRARKLCAPLKEEVQAKDLLRLRCGTHGSRYLELDAAAHEALSATLQIWIWENLV